MAQFDAPRSIGARGITDVESKPGAAQVPTGLGRPRSMEVQDAFGAEETGLGQLGKALSGVAAPGSSISKLGAAYVEGNDTQAAALGEQYKTRYPDSSPEQALIQATQAGLIPWGASGPFLEAAQVAEIKSKALNFKANIFESYEKTPEVKNSDDPVTEFAAGQKKSFVDTFLNNPDGSPKYTPLEVSKSNVLAHLDEATSSLHSHHVNEGIKRRETQGYENARQFASVGLDKAHAEDPSNFDKQAGSLMQNLRGPGTIGAAGVDHPKTNEIAQDIILAKGKELGDTKYADEIARRLINPATQLSMADSPKFKAANEANNRRIRADKVDAIREQDLIDNQPLKGKDLEARLAEGKAKFENSRSDIAKKQYGEELKQKITDYDPATMTAADKQAQAEARTELGHLDTELLVRANELWDKKTNPGEDKINKLSASKHQMDLEHDIVKNPTDIRGNIKKAEDLRLGNKITDKQLEDLKKLAKEAHEGHDVINSPAGRNFMDAGGEATLPTGTDKMRALSPVVIQGQHQGRLAAAQALLQDYRDHPDDNMVQRMGRLTPQLKTIGEMNNTTKKENVRKALEENTKEIELDRVKVEAGRRGVTEQEIDKALSESNIPPDDHEGTLKVVRGLKHEKRFGEVFGSAKPYTSHFSEGTTPAPQPAPVQVTPSPVPTTPAAKVEKGFAGLSNDQKRYYVNATREMGLNDQEKSLYRRHLDNLYGTGKVKNPDGSISTIRQTTVTIDGRTYNMPTVWDGKEHTGQETVAYWRQHLNMLPSYKTVKEAEARYQLLHKYMEQDVQQYLSTK